MWVLMMAACVGVVFVPFGYYIAFVLKKNNK